MAPVEGTGCHAPVDSRRITHLTSSGNTLMSIEESTMRKNRLRVTLAMGIAIPVLVGVAVATSAQADDQAGQKFQTEYVITELPSLGGTSDNGIGVNNRGWVAGSSNLPGDAVTHATLWRNGS